ncbi:MAG: tetraacyldisaccharide 4'-kinase [Bacteroidetes bacterium]|nr:tetraacyldisaccharide 4'-kinase [Bacteroidota bacterium]
MKTVLSAMYGLAVDLRNRAYDRGRRAVTRAGVPVISVGNISAGGAGKTPVVAFLAEWLIARGASVAVVSRGYRRETTGTVVVSDGRGHLATPREGGDEPVMLARRLPELVVIADERRSRGCERAVTNFGAGIILLDDGFQHRAVYRDMDIVVVDANEALAEARLLPAGRLREPLSGLRRADAILLSKCQPGSDIETLRATLAGFSDAPVFATRFVPRTLRRLGEGDDLPLDTLQGLRVGAFSGIGTPEGFRRTLQEIGITPVVEQEFRDHFWYRPADMLALQKAGAAQGVQVWITTEKDATRLSDTDVAEKLGELFYLRMEVEFVDGEEEFYALIAARSGWSSGD